MNKLIRDILIFVGGILIWLVIIATIYFLIPKYYFIEKDGFLKYRCNQLTGYCEGRSGIFNDVNSNGNWTKINK